MRNIVLALALGVIVVGNAEAAKPMKFSAQLDGFNAGGAPIPTNAQGRAVVEVIDDGTAVNFRVKVAGIDNLLMAHIHIAPAPVMLTDPAGPIAYWFTGGPPPGTPPASCGSFASPDRSPRRSCSRCRSARAGGRAWPRRRC